MNIAPTPPPVTTLNPEVPRPLQPPAHESTRPVIAPNGSEAMTQETRRDETRRADRKSDHDPQTHGGHPHHTADHAAVDAQTPTSTESGRTSSATLTVGALIDVFA